MNLDLKNGLKITLGQATIDELKRLTNEHGGTLHPEKIVEAARDKKSILHSRFEWDNNEAAERYRLIQARYMLNIAVEVIPGNRMRSKVFVSLRRDRYDGGGYRTTVDVLSDSQLHQQMLDDALENMEHFRLKYQELKELHKVVLVMKKTERHLKAQSKPQRKELAAAN